MKSQLSIKPDNACINIVVSTGCPNSGWENALPVLRQLGFDEADDTFSKWNDELFREAGMTDRLQLNQPFQPSQRQAERAMALLSGEPGTPLLWTDDRNLWLLDFWAASFPQVSFLLLYTRAESALAYGLQQGMEPEQLMQDWQAANQHLMRFQRRNRRRSLLLDAEAAAQYPQALADACQCIGLELQPENSLEAVATTAPAIERLLANQYLCEQSAIHALQMELEASAQPLGDTDAHQPLQLMELYQGYQQWQTQIETQSKIGKKQAELAADYKAQLEVALQAKEEQGRLADDRQAQIEQLTKAKEKQAADYQAQLSQARQDQEALTAASKETEQENELLLLQLHQVQEELEEVFLRKQQLEQSGKEQDVQLEQLRQQLDQSQKALQAAEAARKELQGKQQNLQTQIERLTQSNNEQSKLAAERQGQIRKLSKERDEQIKLAKERQSQLTQAKQAQEKLEAASKETEQENELLLLQLHQVQEELELYFLKYQELAKETKKETEKGQETAEVSGDSVDQKNSVESGSPSSPQNTSAIRFLIKPFRPTSKQKKREKRQVRLIKTSGLFDTGWYLTEYSDVAEAGIGPIEHYLRFGAEEGRNPSPKFDTVYYLATNPDISVTVTNPLVHYIQFGREEGRAPSRRADTIE